MTCGVPAVRTGQRRGQRAPASASADVISTAWAPERGGVADEVVGADLVVVGPVEVPGRTPPALADHRQVAVVEHDPDRADAVAGRRSRSRCPASGTRRRRPRPHTRASGAASFAPTTAPTAKPIGPIESAEWICARRVDLEVGVAPADAVAGVHEDVRAGGQRGVERRDHRAPGWTVPGRARRGTGGAGGAALTLRDEVGRADTAGCPAR